MAYENPQWRTFKVENENVPTWNYQSVHVYGTASIMSEQELEEDDYHNIVNKLYEEKDLNSQQMAQLMER